MDDVIYDEVAVPDYNLPSVLTSQSGKTVTAFGWQARRQEMLALFAEHVYGYTPTDLPAVHYEVLEEGTAPDGLATRQQVRLSFNRAGKTLATTLLLYTPRAERPVPGFLALNFKGNLSVHSDAAVLAGRHDTAKWGEFAGRWELERILSRGYALATLHYEDLFPDTPGGAKDSVHQLYPELTGETSWGAIGVWAWGLSRALDYLETDDKLDVQRVAVLGHSRLAKAALWAAAQDERFALAVSNNSGCGGAALSRRCYGERVHHINTRFPHWFAEAFKRYNYNEAELPVDQHMLLALMAPRPLYVASAEADRWADPKGEFLSAKHAGEVYRLLGETAAARMPALHEPVMTTLGYHIRAGEHDVTAYDWEQYLAFADEQLGFG